jgi:hypothetical protein
VLRRFKRVACSNCGAMHPAIYQGQQCLICASAMSGAGRKQRDGDTRGRRKRVAMEQEVRIAALQSECDALRAALDALTHHDAVTMSEYGRYVEASAKGIAERDTYPMPRSVATRKAFYEIMADAALEAIDLRSLMESLPRADRQLKIGRAHSVARTPEAGSAPGGSGRGRHLQRRIRPHST